MSFLSCFCGFWIWLSKLVRPEVVKVSPTDTTESTDNPWCELFKEICKVNAFDLPNLLLVKRKLFSDSIHDTFEQLWKTKKYDDVVWLLLLASLDKVTKENDEFRNSFSQLQMYMI